MILIKQVGLLWLSALLIVVGFHLALLDLLLFRSDPYSLSAYLFSSSAFVLVLLALVSLACMKFLPRLCRRIYEMWAFLTGIAICIAFLVLLLGLFRINIDLGVLLKPYVPIWILEAIKATALYLAPFIAIATFALAFAARTRLQIVIPIIAKRVELIGLFVLAYAFFGVPLTYVADHFTYGMSVPAAESKGKHLLLIILDGFPAEHLNSYNRHAARTSLDEVIGTGRVFTQVRTSAPYTSGYFATLYSGNVGANTEQGNLFERLQRSGIAVQLTSFHRNGFPEGSLANIGHYRGLRSALLNPNFAWIPEMLGLDYHLALWYEPTSLLAKMLLRPISHYLISEKENALERTLIPQLRATRKGAEGSFVIFHVYHVFPSSTREQSIPTAQFAGGQELAIVQEMRDRDYRYDSEHEPYIASMREHERINVETVGEELRAFIGSIEKDDELRDTAIILTADHGSMSSKGRVWYAFHPNEEAIRVPLVVWNYAESGADRRLLTSVDITKSILDFYGIESPFDDDAVSIFGSDEHTRTATLTDRSDINDEWFLVLTDGREKFQANIHPSGNGETTQVLVNGYDEKIEATFDIPPPQIAEEVHGWLNKFNVNPHDVHPNFR